MNEVLFASKVVFITGASSGIGEEFAKQLQRRGATVVLVARREDRLKALSAHFNAIRSGSAEYLTADLADLAHSLPGEHVIEKYLKNNRVDILINNAGFGSFGRFDELALTNEALMVSVNAAATVRLAHAVIPQMRERKEGGIISVSSVAGIQPLPYMATYSATKAFNYYHSLALHYELKEFGVRVLAVCPGPVATEFKGIARVPGTVGNLGRDSAEVVVHEALEAYAAGKPWIVPCLRAKLMAGLARLLPRKLTTWVIGSQLRKVAELRHTS